MQTQDEALRELLAQADPVAAAAAPQGAFERISAQLQDPPQRPQAPRRWQAVLLGAAVVATLALATALVAPGLLYRATGGASDAASEAGASPQKSEPAAAQAPLDSGPVSEPGTGAMAQDGRVPDSATAQDGAQPQAPAQQLVRSASLLVGTDDTAGAAAAFAERIAALGGRVLSQSVVAQGGGAGPNGQDIAVPSDPAGISMPYPWYPVGPGVFLTVEVPADRFEEAVLAARSSGEVVQLQQSSYDVGTQVADVAARIAALQASLARLTALLDQAAGVSDVVALESAISARQAELDGLAAQQRELANQTSMGSISLSLMSPRDARDAVDPQPSRSWWESLLEGLADLWRWLGQALLITSPLLAAGAVIWWAGRRRRRSA